MIEILARRARGKVSEIRTRKSLLRSYVWRNMKIKGGKDSILKMELSQQSYLPSWYSLTCGLHYCSGISCFFRCQVSLKLRIKLHPSISQPMHSSPCEEVRSMCAWQKSRTGKVRKF